MQYRKGTFIIVPNRDYLRGMNATEQVVFLWLCSYADEHGICFPSRTTLARDTGLSVRSIDEAIRVLEVRNLVEKTPRKDPKNPQRNLSNYYQIMVPEEVNVVHELHQGGAGAARGVVQELRTNYNHKNSQKINSGAKAPPSFVIVSDVPTSRAPKKDTGVMRLRDRLYEMFEEEYGTPSSANMGDYVRIQAALKHLSEKQVIDMVEDALEGSKPPHTVREALTDRAIDVYRHEHA